MRSLIVTWEKTMNKIRKAGIEFLLISTQWDMSVQLFNYNFGVLKTCLGLLLRSFSEVSE